MFMCKPEKNKKQSTATIIIFILIALIFAILSAISPAYKWFFQLLFIAATAVVIFVLTRYTMAQWIYRVEGSTFEVIKQSGSKSTTVCSLELAESLLLIAEVSFRRGVDKDKYDGVIHKQFNYCQNLNADAYCYVFKFQDRNFVMRFEPNEAFIQLLNEAIAESKKK